MSTLREALRDYLRIRRGLGFELRQEGRMLEDFVAFLERADADRITTKLALEWATQVRAHPHWHRRRLGLVRGFAQYVATLDPTTEVPSKDLLPAHRRRVPPYIYSPAEIQMLIAAAGRLTPELRALRHQTLISLLAATGLRPGEALALDRQDVDLKHGALHVRAGKHDKQREVPLHPTTTTALGDYARARDRRFPEPSTPAFFIGARGRRMPRGELNRTFTQLIRETGLEGRGHRKRPRPHDLRHSFSVNTLIDSYAAGEDLDRKLPLLSTYLGHVNPSSTYWYMEAVPELLQLISARLEGLPETLS